jgi:VWFA-related protein
VIKATTAAVAFAAATLFVQRPPAATPGDLVELDVVVVGRDGQTVPGLGRDDFEIKDDGRRVDITTFEEIRAIGSRPSDDARSVVVLLDDIGVPASGTLPMRGLARRVVSLARVADEVVVVRLSKDADEAFGDMTTALARIDAYAPRAVPFSPRDARDAALKAVTKISRAAEAVEHRRTVIVCIGTQIVCDVTEPGDGRISFNWQYWVEALTSAARANVSVYSIDPTRLNRRGGRRAYGLIALTGGELFANSADVEPAIRSIWWEASRYYLLGYWPPATKRELHDIDVKVQRTGLTVRARRRR